MLSTSSEEHKRLETFHLAKSAVVTLVFQWHGRKTACNTFWETSWDTTDDGAHPTSCVVHH